MVREANGCGRPGKVMRAVLVAALASASVLACASAPAEAQFFWSQPRYDADDAARIAIQHGFRVLARPTRNDDVYVAEVIDRRGARGRLIIAAETGAIVQRYFSGGRRYRPDFDPAIPAGPVPPGRIPDEDRRPGFFARLFGNDDAEERTPRNDRVDRPPVPEDAIRPRRSPRSRAVEQAPLDTIRPAAVETKPLAPPSAAPTLPPRVATPKPAPPVPAQASLPPQPATPVAPAAPGRSISTNPLAIPGSREQDERNTSPTKPSEAKAQPVPVAQPVKPLELPKAKPAATVPVAPLE